MFLYTLGHMHQSVSVFNKRACDNALYFEFVLLVYTKLNTKLTLKKMYKH